MDQIKSCQAGGHYFSVTEIVAPRLLWIWSVHCFFSLIVKFFPVYFNAKHHP